MVPSHLTLAQRKAVSPRIHFFEATHGGKTLLDFAKEGAAPDFGHLWDTLTFLAKRGFSEPPSPTDSPDTIPLDHFLHSLEADFSTSVRPLFKESPRPLTVSLAEHLSNGLKSVSCSVCSDKKPVCDGTDDDPIVANGGLCILPLKMIFAWATEVATRYYRHSSPLFRRLPPPITYLSTAHSRFAKTQYPVGGTTFYHDGVGGRRVSEIRLALSVNEMDFETYLAIPYVFFHELVCHAFAYTALKTGKRQESEPEDPFAEGWMDFVCMGILSEFLEGSGPAADLTKEVRFPWGYLEHGNELHARRSRVGQQSLTQPGSQATVSVALGKRTARKVRHFLTLLAPTEQAAQQEFLELSLGLNLHAFPGKGLEYFVWQLDALLEESGVLPFPDRLERSTEIFSNYLKTKRIVDLYDAVIHTNIRLTSE
jgi:hypothetical protein